MVNIHSCPVLRPEILQTYPLGAADTLLDQILNSVRLTREELQVILELPYFDGSRVQQVDTNSNGIFEALNQLFKYKRRVCSLTPVRSLPSPSDHWSLNSLKDSFENEAVFVHAHGLAIHITQETQTSYVIGIGEASARMVYLTVNESTELEDPKIVAVVTRNEPTTEAIGQKRTTDEQERTTDENEKLIKGLFRTLLKTLSNHYDVRPQTRYLFTVSGNPPSLGPYSVSGIYSLDETKMRSVAEFFRRSPELRVQTGIKYQPNPGLKKTVPVVATVVYKTDESELFQINELNALSFRYLPITLVQTLVSPPSTSQSSYLTHLAGSSRR